MTETARDPFPQFWDWVFLVAFIASVVMTTMTFGLAGLIVYLMLCFAAYRLGKAVGR